MAEKVIEGTSIHYVRGEGFDDALPTVLMIHGAGQSAATWDRQIDLLRNYPKANFIIPDLPGHGKSGGDGFKTVGGYADFLGRFIDSMNLQNLILMGHSMGGGAAMLYTLENPGNVTACILAATGARLRVAGQTLEAAKNNYGLFCEIASERMFAAGSPSVLKNAFKQGLMDTNPGVSYWDLVACNEFDIMEDVSGIAARTLIISGSEDILTPPEYGDYLHSRIRGSVHHEIQGSGHFMMQEKSEEFNTLLTDFLNDLTDPLLA